MGRVNAAYVLPLLLIASIVSGGLTGCWLGSKALYLKPIGDIFLNLILTAIVPLIFFSIAAAIANIDSSKALLKLFIRMMVVFVGLSLVAALWMLAAVHLFPPAGEMHLPLSAPMPSGDVHALDKIASYVSASSFNQLLSHEHMLALIVFAILVGIATFRLGEEAHKFKSFLQVGSAVFFKVMALIMTLAPLGFFAYFAVLVATIGPKLFNGYVWASAMYYGSGLIYFVVLSSLYAYVADHRCGVKRLWRHIWLPAVTALATCSSAASIPANLTAVKRMGVAAPLAETVVPLGGLLHKDGSVLGAIVKIAFLFGVFHLSFSSPWVIITAVFVAMLVGTVMGAIPSGGMLGEMVILSLYGFPPQALMIIAAISIIIDPLATMLNVTGNTVAGLLIARLSQRAEA